MEAQALFDFQATKGNQLSMKKGEKLTIEQKTNENWWIVINSSGGRGYAPALYIKEGPGEKKAPSKIARAKTTMMAKEEAKPEAKSETPAKKTNLVTPPPAPARIRSSTSSIKQPGKAPVKVSPTKFSQDLSATQKDSSTLSRHSLSLGDMKKVPVPKPPVKEKVFVTSIIPQK